MSENQQQRSERMRRIGRIGGLKNKERRLAENPFYFEELGYRGGIQMTKLFGKDYFSRLGKRSLEVNGREHLSRIGKIGAHSRNRNYGFGNGSSKV